MKKRFNRYQFHGLHHNPNQSFQRIKIDSNVIQVCEIGNKINNQNCKHFAYRKIFSNFGYKWSCDNCAALLCEHELIET